MKKKIITLIIAVCSNFCLAQICVYDHILNKLNHKNYSTYESIYNTANFKLANNNDTYYIPVVFHVVYNTEAQNIPDSVLISQIEVLNEDYRRLNENASETREEFEEFAGDPNIEFFLANIDPNGNPTNGIVRQYTERDEFSMFENFFSQEISLDEVKSSQTGGSNPWNTSRYLNIWICNIAPLSIDISLLDFDGDGEPDINLDFNGDGEPDINLDDFEGGGQVFGYAYPPVNVDEALIELSNTQNVPDWPTEMLTNDENVQGVVIHYTTAGRNNPVASEDNMTENNLGRTLVHEVGHYLGLRHTWGDALGTDGCAVDDGISDTPNASNNAGYVCDLTKNTCNGDTFGSGSEDLPDMVENYMDYSPDACLNMFTNGQINVMRNILELARPELINESPSLNNTEIALINNDKRIVKYYDILGRKNNSKNLALKIHLYNDGSVQKYIRVN